MMELRLAVVLLGLSSGDAEPFLFMDLEDVQAPWGLLQPRASTVTRNDTFAPPCVAASVPERPPRPAGMNIGPEYAVFLAQPATVP